MKPSSGASLNTPLLADLGNGWQHPLLSPACYQWPEPLERWKRLRHLRLMISQIVSSRDQSYGLVFFLASSMKARAKHAFDSFLPAHL